MDQTPASLLERLRHPADSEAWPRFVRLYTPLLCYWARRRGLQESDADDLVQDVLLVVYQKLPEFTYDRAKSFRGWLWTVLVNKAREHRRRAGAVAQVADGVLAGLTGPEDEQTPEEEEYRQFLVARALEVMQSEFQPTTWRACWEFVAGGRSAAEVAIELGLSAGAVRAAKFRVLARLRQELHGLLD